MLSDYEIRTNIMNVLVECRKDNSLTQEQLAALFNVKPTTVASWEQGKSLPSPQMLYRLALYYKKSMDFMYGKKDDEEV